MEDKSQYIQVFTTAAKKSDTERIAKLLLNKKLSACTQIMGPITSVYQWKGKTKKSKEWLCVIKTNMDLYKKIEKTIKEIHPYEVPEIIATPIIRGSKEYLAWMDKNKKAPK